MSGIKIITANWPAPDAVQAFTTTRQGGVSAAPYDDLNLADHVNDHPDAVQDNRSLLQKQFSLPAEPVWLKQVHGSDVVDASFQEGGMTTADGSYTSKAGVVCAVLTADCLPVCLVNNTGSWVAVLHAGWRGLAAGVIESGLRQYNGAMQDCMAWLGPAIGVTAFEVGPEVREQFGDLDNRYLDAFNRSRSNRWYMDIYAIARMRLVKSGVSRIYGGEYCTFNDEKNFYSYRRQHTCGRMATLIRIK